MIGAKKSIFNVSSIIFCWEENYREFKNWGPKKSKTTNQVWEAAAQKIVFGSRCEDKYFSEFRSWPFQNRKIFFLAPEPELQRKYFSSLNMFTAPEPDKRSLKKMFGSRVEKFLVSELEPKWA